MKEAIVMSPDSVWFAAVEKSWEPWGVAERHEGDAALRRLAEASSALVVVDGSYIDDIDGTITRILRESPDARVVVATASPSWRRAREALLAGAADYIRRTTNVAYLSARWEQVLVESADARRHRQLEDPQCPRPGC
jgi:DNA-binding response OmpR family regulator